jgi:hypothetical protein
MFRFKMVLVGLGLVAVSNVWANDDNWAKDEPPPPVKHTFAIGLGSRYGDGISYLLHAEWAQDRKLGFSGFLGFGLEDQTLVNQYGNTAKGTVRSLTLGLEAAYYVLGDFDAGLKAGVAFLTISNSHGTAATYADQGAGQAGGVFVGGRYVLPLGLTMDAVGGVAGAFLDEFNPGPGDPPNAKTSVFHVQPYVRAAVGWAF